jgi:S1-C subfamily serine protease
LIVGLNGEGVGSVDDIHKLLTRVHAGTAIRLTVLRAGSRVELEFLPSQA